MLAEPEVSRGLSVGDVDGDGDLDVLLANNAGPLRLLINGAGQDRSWIAFEVPGPGGAWSAPSGLGGRHRGDPGDRDGAARRAGRVRTDGSYASAHAPRVLFGLGPVVDGATGEARDPAVRLRSPGGGEAVWRGLDPGRVWIVYGDDGSEEMER